MKKATCILYEDLTSKELIHGNHWGLCAFVHDEWQILARTSYENVVADVAIQSITKAAIYFKLLCPFTGEARVGKNWMETH